MVRSLLLLSLGAALGSGVAIHAMTTTVAVEDKCRLYGYTRCEVIGAAELPSTRDPKLRSELTRHIRQMVRDRSKG